MTWLNETDENDETCVNDVSETYSRHSMTSSKVMHPRADEIGFKTFTTAKFSNKFSRETP